MIFSTTKKRERFMINMVWKASKEELVEVVAVWTTFSRCSWVAEVVVAVLEENNRHVSNQLPNKLRSHSLMSTQARKSPSMWTDKESAVPVMVSEDLMLLPFRHVPAAKVEVYEQS